MILLDTCTLVWLAMKKEKLSSLAVQTIKDHPGRLFISSATAFEVAIKQENKKLNLPFSADIWISKVKEALGINEIAVSSEIATYSVLLPKIHRDPCDRLLVATAKIHQMTLITPDQYIKSYPEVRVIW